MLKQSTESLLNRILGGRRVNGLPSEGIRSVVIPFEKIEHDVRPSEYRLFF
jgi:hypothetical protein